MPRFWGTVNWSQIALIMKKFLIASSGLLSVALMGAANASAIRDLVKQGAGSIPQIAEYLKDPEPGVRHEAIRGLTELGTGASLDPLIRALADNDPENQMSAIDGLVNFYLPGYVKTGIVGAVKKAGTAVKSRFAETNDQVIDGYVEVRPDVITAIGRIAKGGSSLEARADAARALGILRARQALPDLAAALESKDSTVIYEVLKAFEKIRDPKAAAYINYLLKDLNEKVQNQAILTAGVLASRDSLPGLRDALRNARTVKLQRQALSAIGKIPDPASRDLFEYYVRDKDADLRGDAAEGFARLGDPADLERMERAFQDDPKPGAKLGFAFAAVALGRLETGPNTPLRYLITELKSKFWGGVAQGYLIELLRQQKVRAAVYPTLRDANKEEKIGLARIFAVSGDAETVKYLEVIQADRDTDVQQEALRAMRTLKARLNL